MHLDGLNKIICERKTKNITRKCNLRVTSLEKLVSMLIKRFEDDNPNTDIDKKKIPVLYKNVCDTE